MGQFSKEALMLRPGAAVRRHYRCNIKQFHRTEYDVAISRYPSVRQPPAGVVRVAIRLRTNAARQAHSAGTAAVVNRACTPTWLEIMTPPTSGPTIDPTRPIPSA